MLVCLIRNFSILRRLKIIKYIEHTLVGARNVHRWTHKAKMAGLFVPFTCGTEPFVVFMRISGDNNAARTATLTKLICALPFT